MPYCRECSLETTGEFKRTVRALTCRSWNCEHCSPQRKRQLIAAALGGKPTTFITLTHRRREGVTPAQAASELVLAWRKFRRAEMTRRTWKRLAFIAIFEAHKSGWPHLHILARCGWIDRQRLSDFMRAEIDSPVVDVRKVDNAGRASSYVAKYTGKAPGKFGTSKRYWQSVDYQAGPKPDPKAPNREQLRWEKKNVGIVARAYQLADAGWDIAFTSMDKAEATRPP